MTTGISLRPALTPVVFPPPQDGKPPPPKNPAAQKAVPPSLAQFAINQQLNRGGTNTLTDSQEKAPTLAGEAVHPASPANELRSLSIYRDADSGKFVSIIRDVASGDVIEQIPEDQMLQFLSRLEHQQKSLRLPPTGSGVNLEA